MANPFFSIIVPTYNRGQQLNNCLEALARLAYPTDCFEVIVVDDGSDKSMSVIVDKYQNLLSVTLLTQANTGPGGARNTGAAQARGRFLAFTDDDCQPDTGWLSALAARFSSEKDIAVGGRTINALSDNLFSVTSQYIHDQVQAHYNQNPFEAHFFASNNLAMPKDLFFSIGGFDNIRFPNASEDRDFCSRWLDYGYRMVYAPEALVCHTHHLSLGRFLLQHFRYGIGAFSFHLACKQRHPGHKIVKMPFYLNVMRDLKLMTGNTPKYRLATGLILWQTANMAGFLWEAAKYLTRAKERISEDMD